MRERNVFYMLLGNGLFPDQSVILHTFTTNLHNKIRSGNIIKSLKNLINLTKATRIKCIE